MVRILGLIGVVAIALGVWLSLRDPDAETVGGGALVEVVVPELSANAQAGEVIFNDNCAVCHGRNAAGNDGAGPPLVHIVYEPGHHADASFYRAVELGVPAHHWRFGDMAPVEGLDRDAVALVIDYVRSLQRANGIN